MLASTVAVHEKVAGRTVEGRTNQWPVVSSPRLIYTVISKANKKKRVAGDPPSSRSRVRGRDAAIEPYQRRVVRGSPRRRPRGLISWVVAWVQRRRLRGVVCREHSGRV
jgi:hypothetical protein